MFRRLLLNAVIFLFAIMVIPISGWPTVRAADNQSSSLFAAPTGPYQVGTVSRYLVDKTRDEFFADDPAARRELMVQFWYPADVTGDAKLAPYLAHSDEQLTNFEKVLAYIAGGPVPLPHSAFAGYLSHAYLGAAVAKAESNYPVLIFSHGYGATPAMYSAQIEELASHGYIVVGISHTFEAAAVVFPDGRTIPLNMAPVTASLPLTLDEASRTWAKDIVFVIDELEKLNSADSDRLFTGRLDLKRLGAFGHSAGGMSISKALHLDKRLKAGLNEDGPIAADVIAQGFDQPFMQMISLKSPFYNESFFQNMRGPLYSLNFETFGHVNFGDFAVWPNMGPVVKVGWLGSADGARSIKMTSVYALAFFDKYLKGTNSTLLDGSSRDYPEVKFAARNILVASR